MSLTILHCLSLLGLALSIYFLHVKRSLKDKNYKAFCDISKTVSCSKAARSKQSSLFILPNAIFGIMFYGLIFLLAFYQFPLIFYLAILASLLSLYLITASIKIRVICPVCILTYVLNFLILYFSF